MRLKDTNGTVHEFEPADVKLVQSVGHGVETVEKNGEPVPAPMSVVWLSDKRSFIVDGPAGTVLGKIAGRKKPASKDGW